MIKSRAEVEELNFDHESQKVESLFDVDAEIDAYKELQEDFDVLADFDDWQTKSEDERAVHFEGRE